MNEDKRGRGERRRIHVQRVDGSARALAAHQKGEDRPDEHLQQRDQSDTDPRRRRAPQLRQGCLRGLGLI